jgi:hypothetical protein
MRYHSLQVQQAGRRVSVCALCGSLLGAVAAHLCVCIIASQCACVQQLVVLHVVYLVCPDPLLWALAVAEQQRILLHTYYTNYGAAASGSAGAWLLLPTAAGDVTCMLLL